MNQFCYSTHAVGKLRKKLLVTLFGFSVECLSRESRKRLLRESKRFISLCLVNSI